MPKFKYYDVSRDEFVMRGFWHMLSIYLRLWAQYVEHYFNGDTPENLCLIMKKIKGHWSY